MSEVVENKNMVYDESLVFHPEVVEAPKKPKRDLK